MKKHVIPFLLAAALLLSATLCACDTEEPTTEPESEAQMIFGWDEESGYSVAMDGKYKDTTLVIPATYEGSPVTGIAHFGFSYGDNLESITLPDSLLWIGDDAFAYCPKLSEIALPDGLTRIGIRAFQKCTSLKSVTIPNTVTTLDIWAFDHCDSLESVVLSDGMTEIDSYVFSDCTSLTSIVFPIGIKSVAADSFQMCSSFSTVFYKGNAKQWENVHIAKDVTGKNEFLNATVYFYSETEPLEDGTYWRYVDGVPTAW